MAVKEKKPVVQEEPVVAPGTDALVLPEPVKAEEEPKPSRLACICDRALYWMKEGSGLRGFAAIVVDKLNMNDEYNLTVFSPGGGATFGVTGRKQSAVPQMGRFTLID